MCHERCRHGDAVVVTGVFTLLGANFWLLRHGHMLISDSVGRAIEKHPFLTLGGLVYILLHWSAVLFPEATRRRWARFDVLGWLARRLGS